MADNNNKTHDSKLVKATELPLHGNPYPPKDSVVTDQPGFLETKIAMMRTAMQKSLSPIAPAYEKTSDVFSTGLAHSQSAFHRLASGPNWVNNSLIVVSSGLFGVIVARRRGAFLRYATGATFASAAGSTLYMLNTNEGERPFVDYIRKDVTNLLRQQYQKITGAAAKETPSAQVDNSKETKK